MITKSGLTEEDLVGLKQEIDILREIKHPNVIGLYSVYENSKTYQLVTELVSGGELFERFVEKESYSEADARVVVRTLMATIAFLHDREIVHRDLKVGRGAGRGAGWGARRSAEWARREVGREGRTGGGCGAGHGWDGLNRG